MATIQRVREDAAQLSSSPAFATPVHPILPLQSRQRPLIKPAFKPAVVPILPILLPPGTLRPLAFRTFTKKYNLTLSSSALQALAEFIGRHCGSAWREDGTGEKVLEEVAKLWKAENGPVIVEDSVRLKDILKTLEGCMSAGRVGLPRSGSSISRESSFAFGNDSVVDLSDNAVRTPSISGRDSSFGMSNLNVQEPLESEDEHDADPRAWLKVISAFEQPRFAYEPDKKHFVPITAKPSLFPSSSHKTAMFKERYHIIYQRILRNEAFQAPAFASRTPSLGRSDSTTAQQFYKITPISNLLGRRGSTHLLFGMLVVAPTGTLALNDITGSITLDLQHAQPLQGPESAYFCPGMIVLVEGMYEDDWTGAGSSGLGDTGGVGGTIGGRFLGFSIGGPPIERRNVSLGVNIDAGGVGGGFGWTDFLGLGSERAVGGRMRKLEQKLIGPDSEHTVPAQRKMVILSEVALDRPITLSALRKVFQIYAANAELPLSFLLMGNFSSRTALAGAGTGSIEYKELFDKLAAALSDFPSLLLRSTWIFVPGDKDAWISAFSAGASSPIPREGIPDLFTTRIKRAFATAKNETGTGAKKDSREGSAIWTSNPARLSWFGPEHEIVVFRDDMSGRFRRQAVRVGQAAQKPVTTEPVAENSGEDVEMSIALPTSESITAVEQETQISEFSASSPPAPTPDTASRPGQDSYAVSQAKKLILSLLPQSTLSPFPLTTRPVHWDFASSALSLYPLPHTVVLADAETPAFALTYEGCHVVNPGPLVEPGSGRRKRVGWIEYDLWEKRGVVMEDWVG